MRLAKVWFGTVAAALIAGGAVAHAETVKPRVTPAPDAFTVRGEFNPQASQFGPLAGRNTVQWDTQKGRWGLRFDIEQSQNRDQTWKDVQASAFFRVTPSLRVGGAVGLGSDPENLAGRAQNQQPAAPRVRLETAFKF